MNVNDFKISPNYLASQWNSLNLSDKDNPDWDKAIDIFEDRMRGRFFRQVDSLNSNPDKNIRSFSGFAIIAIDCLLIETLGQFQVGKKRTGKDKDVEIFHKFFQLSNTFKSFFTSLEKTEVFYSQIRCGILHQAQTKKQSLIHIKRGTQSLAWIDNKNIQKGISINRDKFHKEIEEIFKSYIGNLRRGKDLNLKRKMERKMNFIAKQS